MRKAAASRFLAEKEAKKKENEQAKNARAILQTQIETDIIRELQVNLQAGDQQPEVVVIKAPPPRPPPHSSEKSLLLSTH